MPEKEEIKSTKSNSEKKEYKVGDKYEVPYEGSLGLLATGHIGLKLWRDKRAEVDAQKKEKTKTDSANQNKAN